MHKHTLTETLAAGEVRGGVLTLDGSTNTGDDVVGDASGTVESAASGSGPTASLGCLKAETRVLNVH